MSELKPCPELNLNNYDEDDVAELNSWAIEAATRIEELEAALNTRPESEAERAIVEYVAIDEALDKPCTEWTNEECNRHRKASQALKDLARKLAGETTTKGE